MENQRNGRIEGRRTSPAEELYDRWNAFVSRLFRAMTAKERFLTLAALALTGVIAYFAAGKGIPFLPEGAGGGLSAPLGDAILCASGVYAPAAYLALLFAARGAGSAFVPRVITLTALFAVRTGLGLRSGRAEGDFRRFYRENTTVKVGSTALFSLFTVGVRMLSHPLTLETLPEYLSMLLLTPALTALLCGAFADKDAVDTVNHRKLTQIYNALSTYIFLGLCVYVLKGETFVGSSLASLAAIFLTVVTAAKGGAIRGGITGAFLGFIVSARHAPILTVTGVFAGVLSGLGVMAYVGIACAAGCLVAVYAYGYRAILTYLPESIIATAITSPVLKYGFLADGFPFHGKRVRRRSGAVTMDGDCTAASSCSEALLRASEAINGLSETAASERGERAPFLPDVELVCDRLKKGFCDSCPMVCICWDNGGKIAEGAVKRRINEIYAPKKQAETPTVAVSRERFKCIRPTEMRQEIIRICETPEVKASALPSPPMGFSEDCRCVARILREVSLNAEEATSLDAVSTANARRAVSALGISAEEIAVFGGRRRTAVLYGADMGAVNDKLERLVEVLSNACGQRLGEPILLSDGGETGAGVKPRRLVFQSELPNVVTYACAAKKASGEERNGDHAACMTVENGWFYSVVCDGMGSGVEASDCSENAVNTLKTLLCSGISPALAAKLTGNAVKDRRDECFTSLDLLAIDAVTGEGCVYKCGAACSLLLRNGEVRILSAPSLPLGISYEAEPEEIPVLLKDGDVVVMISDGVAEEEADELRLSERLSLIRETEPEGIAERLLSEALADRERRGGRRDDMTVAVVKMQSAQN